MQELWASASYQPHALSLAFAFAPVAMSIVIAYALAMRGAAALRGWLLLHFASLLPYAICVMLSPSLRSPALAGALFRVAGAFIPMAAAAGAGFQLALLGRRSARMRALVWVGVAAAAVWIVVGSLTDASVTGVRMLPAGLWFPNAGAWAWLEVATTLAVSLPGFVLLAIAAVRSPPSLERRQLRSILVANLVTYSGLLDISLAYGIDVMPVGWLLSGAGSLLVVRALFVEDLLRARAFDTTGPRLVLHFALAVGFGAIALDMLGGGALGWRAAALVLVGCFALARVAIAVVGLIHRWTPGPQSTLDRLLGQLVARARNAQSAHDVARLAIDVIELGIGVHVEVLLAAAEDWGFTTAAGVRLPDEAAPDPLLVGWLVEQRGVRLAHEIADTPEDLRPLLAQLYDHNAARAIVPVTSDDDLLALVVVIGDARVRGRALEFLERASERLGEALVHVRMAKRAADHAVLAREVELAAAVQQQLLPGKGPHVHGDVTVVGSWLPATRCAGDFWGVYALDSVRGTDSSGSMTRGPGGRVLVVLGDVTGHGVAPATVTAAAAAACDVAVRRYGGELELERLVAALDAAVRRIAGGHLPMSCSATILDPAARELRFVSCGHPTPYLCRPDGASVELQALVGRGNPLGGPGSLAAKVQQRSLEPGDLVVWYTDGVVDAMDPAGQQFGDRRLQRMLKKLDGTHLAPSAVHSLLVAAVAAHHGARARDDDETLVVAHWQPREAKP